MQILQEQRQHEAKAQQVMETSKKEDEDAHRLKQDEEKRRQEKEIQIQVDREVRDQHELVCRNVDLLSSQL